MTEDTGPVRATQWKTFKHSLVSDGCVYPAYKNYSRQNYKQTVGDKEEQRNSVSTLTEK